MILLIDNYDSFTYNLVQYFGDLGADVVVHRNDMITVDQALALAPTAIVLSPGPRSPCDAGICLDLVTAAAHHNIPLLGVCLGHQTIGEAFGGQIVRAPNIKHGNVSTIRHTNKGIFKKLPIKIDVTRYHSLIINQKTCPDCLEITSTSCDDQLIMSVQHRDLPIHGVQFHPESIATQYGHDMLKNFLDLVKEQSSC